MSTIPKRYDSKGVDDKLYNLWCDLGLNKSVVQYDKKSYTILQPPPNVTGYLHIGHALNNVYQDVMIRFKRLQGYNTCWVPGTDHGGIATQNVVEKQLSKGKIRKEMLGREKFLKIINEWTKDKQTTIKQQLIKLGCLCSWDRQQFTMSEKSSKWVRKVFKQWYDKGLIYQGEYMINWCPRCKTALANDEVEHKECKSKIYTIKYMVEGGNPDEYLEVATTRPETILGDVAVIHHPDDERYAKFKGMRVVVPIVGRSIPILEDKHAKKEFGTGVVKITPAHDKNDFEVSKRHSLESVLIMNQYGKIENSGTKYDGLDRFRCRKEILVDLKKDGLLLKVENHKNSVGSCYRCKTVVEPRLSKQWFVNMEELGKKAVKSIESGDIELVPSYNVNVFKSWFAERTDWCISRQLWWGHQIPVWYCKGCHSVMCEEEPPNKCVDCGSSELEQDPDVLDTWFSSALWGFSVFDTEEELDYYFPSDLLITGKDILFFWVARMIIASNETMKKAPFKKVYLHGVVRDKDRIKMSKSLGNTIDPLSVIDSYSADIVRYTLVTVTPKGQDAALSPQTFKLGKLFCTKLWNSFRYMSMNMEKGKMLNMDLDEYQLDSLDRWVILEAVLCKKRVGDLLDKCCFAEAIKSIHSFVWNTFCNTYLEFAKTKICDEGTCATLIRTFEIILIMLHPFIPFITEELYQHLGKYRVTDKQSILQERWDKSVGVRVSSDEIEDVLDMLRVVEQVRSQKSGGKKQFKVNCRPYVRSNIGRVCQVCRVDKIDCFITS